MKRKIKIILMAGVMMMMAACGNSKETDTNVEEIATTQVTESVESITDLVPEEKGVVTESLDATQEKVTEEQTTESEIEISEPTTEEMKEEDNTFEEATTDMYAGIYNDYDNNEPNLTIELKEDGSYSVVIGIFRLLMLEDGVGTLTDKGLEFVATDPAGNPIEGVITLEGNEAVVTFTNSTWADVENGSSYKYARAE